MASQFDYTRLCAIVHSDNYPVIHWMKKLSGSQELIHDWCVITAGMTCSRYWVFGVPIRDSWIADEAIRQRLVSAASGKGSIEPECMNEVRKSVRSGSGQEE